MSQRTSRRKSEAIRPEQVYRVLKAGPLTTKQICTRTCLSGNGAEHMLRTLPGIHHGKNGQTNLWSLE